jgi:hypothetical protein
MYVYLYQTRSLPVVVQTRHLDLRIEWPREFLAQLNLILGAACWMVDQSSASPRDWRTESDISLAASRLTDSDRPGMQAIVGSDRMHEPATLYNVSLRASN